MNHIHPFIDYIADDKTDEKLRDLFDFYDVDRNGMIQRQELIDVLSLCAHEIGLDVDTYLEQIADAVFSNADLNQSGSITFEALKKVLKERPNLTNELALAKVIHQSNSASGTVSKHKEACRGARQFAAAQWERFACFLGSQIPICNKLRWEYISNNLVRFNFFLTIILISLVLIAGRVASYWGSCGWVIVARCGGQCLNFLCSIIVLLVCRRSITLLRSRGWGRYLPLDDHVYFHKMLGLFIVFHSLVHTLGHLVNFSLEASKAESKFTYAEFLFTTKAQIGWIGGAASITGWFLLVIIAIMSLAQPFSRSLGKFELFYYTHLLYIPFWALLIVHAPRFWIWFLGPFLVFSIEASIRVKNLFSCLTTSGPQTTILRAVPLPSDVLHLVIKRPANFEYNPGDWIYVLIPQIAKYEWHPFTISSAPEQEGVIWLHIRAVGEWTRSLRAYFECLEHRNHLSRFIRSGQFSMSMDQQAAATIDLSAIETMQPDCGAAGCSQLDSTACRLKLGKLERLKRRVQAMTPIPEGSIVSATGNGSTELKQMGVSNASASSEDSQADLSLSTTTSSAATTADVSTTSQRLARSMPNITVFVDGPYGSPSSQIFRAEHAVLIATGIGVTPFASILQSIVNHYEKRRQKCPNCALEFSDTRPPILCKLRKVDFMWINRDQKSFEWFIKLLAELELTQSQLPPSERFLDIHIHLTTMDAAKTKTVGLQLALYLVHEKNKKDLVTGLRTRTKAGRPDWNEFFEQVQEQKKGKVSVFFCGQPQLGRLLHRKCDSFGFKFRKEIF